MALWPGATADLAQLLSKPPSISTRMKFAGNLKLLLGILLQNHWYDPVVELQNQNVQVTLAIVHSNLLQE